MVSLNIKLLESMLCEWDLIAVLLVLGSYLESSSDYSNLAHFCPNGITTSAYDLLRDQWLCVQDWQVSDIGE